MTWQEVTDTAVKIGLSGFVGGFFAYQMAKRSQAHDLRKEHMRRLQDTLEEFSKDFENVHSSFVARCATHYSVLPRTSIDSALSESKEMLLKLHQLEGRLLLFGLADSARILRQYRLVAAQIEETSIHDLEAPKKLRPVADNLCTLKDTVYKELSKIYKGA